MAKQLDELPSEIKSTIVEDLDKDAQTQFANTSRSNLEAVLASEVRKTSLPAGFNKRGRAPRTAYVAGIEEFVSVLETSTKRQFDAVCECIRHNTIHGNTDYWNDPDEGHLSQTLRELVHSIVVMHLQSLSKDELMSEIYAALAAMTSNPTLLVNYGSKRTKSPFLVGHPVCAPGSTTEDEHTYRFGPFFFIDRGPMLVVYSLKNDKFHYFHIRNFPSDDDLRLDQLQLNLHEAADNRCEIVSITGDEPTLIISLIAELVSSFFDQGKFFEDDGIDVATKPLVQMLDESTQVQFDAICLRISNSQPDFRGKEHLNVNTFVERVVFYHLQKQETIADVTDQIYIVLQALASKDELLIDTPILDNHQCGEICVPAKKPTNFNFMAANPYSHFYVCHKNVVHNADEPPFRIFQSHNALLVVNHRYFPIQNFPERRPANLKEALQLAAVNKCLIVGRTNKLIELIAKVVSSFFYPDAHRADQVARIRRAFVDFCHYTDGSHSSPLLLPVPYIFEPPTLAYNG